MCCILNPGARAFNEAALRDKIAARNQRLLLSKRISGYVVWEADFPANRLAENQTRSLWPKQVRAAVCNRATPWYAAVSERFLALVNPAAACGDMTMRQAGWGGARKLCARRGIEDRSRPKLAAFQEKLPALAREAYARGARNFHGRGG